LGAYWGADSVAYSAEASRSHQSLIALYDFSADDGPIVRDRSGVDEPLDLRIENMDAVRREAGVLEIHGKTIVRSQAPARKIIDAVRRSNALSIEAWVRPAKTNLTGPARIVTLSRDTSRRNFTLGQEGDRYDFRLRTTRTSENGLPSLAARGGSLRSELTHIVFTRDRDGRAKIYVNGKPNAEKGFAGDLKNWDGSYRFALGNELRGDRPWQGAYRLVAIYSRDLSAEEVARHHRSGPASEALQQLLAEARAARNTRRFHSEIAPLLIKHCFECHDASSNEGGLDLSRRKTAFAGGEGGPALVPGDADKSRLWEMVASDEMPQDRKPLSDDQKRMLREWIDNGATWPAEVIDPVVYRHGSQTVTTFVQRLTVPEYIATVRSTVGVDIEKDARKLLPPDVRADGFRNTAYNLNVDLGHVEAYARLAEIIVDRIDVGKFAARFTDSRKLDDDNMRALIRNMGRPVLRGPLEEREVEAYLQIAQAVERQDGDFEEAAGYILQAMLQAPRFIYRIERQRGDGTPQRVGPYELASRMSYILWGAPPDEELYRAAGAGALADPANVEAQVRRMLKDPRALGRSKQFLAQWLRLGRLENLRPDPERFPKWDAALADDMRQETLTFFEEIAWKQRRPLSDLFNAQLTFATARLAKHYGLNVKDEDQGLTRYDVSNHPARGGLLTQGSVLTVGGDEASMVARGLFVLHDVLRGEVKDPPPCVDTTPVPTKEGLTQRGIAMQRIANNSCGGCHSKFEPLAFGLEKFDGLGAHHERDEYGNVLREDGEILFPGNAQPVEYETSAELMNLLAQSDRVSQTLTWKVTQFALGRPLTAADAPVLAKIHADAQAAGGDYASLITAIVMSDLVQKTRTEP